MFDYYYINFISELENAITYSNFSKKFTWRRAYEAYDFYDDPGALDIEIQKILNRIPSIASVNSVFTFAEKHKSLIIFTFLDFKTLEYIRMGVSKKNIIKYKKSIDKFMFRVEYKIDTIEYIDTIDTEIKQEKLIDIIKKYDFKPLSLDVLICTLLMSD